jgi:predicted acyltransferase
MYLGVFLTWNDYPNKDTKIFRVTGLRLAGMALLCFLVMKFKSGQPENNGSLVTEWWGILGLIGWGYLVSAFTYVLCRDSILQTAGFAVFFLVLNMLSGWHLINVPGIVSTVFGVIIDGNVPFIVLSGLIAGLIIKKLPLTEFRKVIPVFAGLGIFYLVSGFVLRKWFIISKIIGTPSWAMICCGISLFVFIIIYWFADVRKLTGWAAFVRPAGENSLTTYLAPDIIYYLIWSSGISILIYKESSNPLIVIAGSLLWSLLMVWLTALLVRLNIRLKL